MIKNQKTKSLNEAITIENATFLASEKGYDIFDILTWEASNAFVVGDSDTLAGQYTHDANTFARNINENQHLYFIVQENTNKVFGAVVKGNNNSQGNIKIISNNQNSNVNLNCNFSFETTPDSNVGINKALPLYLIPDSNFENVTSIPNSLIGTCLIIQNNTLKAVIPQTTEYDVIDSLDLRTFENVTKIDKDAFNYGLAVNTVIINSHITDIPANTFSNVTNIKVAEKSASDSWSNDWNAGKENATEYYYEFTEDQLQEIENERQEEERRRQEEILRQQEEERRRQEEERLRAEREARKIRYRVEGKNITITGTRKGVSKLDIPEEIEGKPVTKIAAYAFYGNEELVQVKVPKSIKLIERSAFAECPELFRVWVAKDCVVGKNNLKVVK